MNTHDELLPKQALGRYWIFSKYWWYFCAQSNCLFLAHWCPLVGFLHWQDACSKSSKDLVRYETKFLSWLPVMAKLIINKPERVFDLQVRCRELGIFKLLRNCWEIFWSFRKFLGIFQDFLEKFFGRNILGGFFLGGFFWEDAFGRYFFGDFLGGILREELLSRN